jgi:hypothetical protein
MASPTRVARYPSQLVIMVSAETRETVDRAAAESGESLSEVARTFLEAGIAAGRAQASATEAGAVL